MQNHFNIRLAKILQADMVFFICVVLHNRYFFMRKEKRKTSLKGYSASKCDIFIIGYFQNILGFFWAIWGEFFGNSLEIVWDSLWKSLGIVNDCLHFQKSTGFWEFFGNSLWNCLRTFNDCLYFQESVNSPGFLHFQSQLFIYIFKVS